MNGRAVTRQHASKVNGRRPGVRRPGGASPAYRRFLPSEFLQMLGKSSVAELRLGDSVERNMSIMFADIRGFTTLSESLTPRETFGFINSYLREMEPALLHAHAVIDKYIGDAIMALFPTGADDAVRSGVAMLERLRHYNRRRRRLALPAVRIGIGLNTGPAMAGAVGGPHRIQTTVISDAVNLASRLEALTKSWGVPFLISEHALYGLTDPAAHDIRFLDRVRIRGKEQPQSIYEVFDADAPAVRAAKRRTKGTFEEALAYYHFKEVPKALRLLRRCLAECPEDAAARVYAERCRRYLRTGVHEGAGENMLAVSWSPAVRIGHPVIDAQHRALFARANAFARAIRRARTGEEARELCAFLRHYIEEHFATEERVMRRARYPLLDGHLRQHARFARDFAILDRELRERLATDRVFLLFRIQLLVMDWLVHHTMKVDKHFGRYLMARARRRRRREVGP